MSDQHDRINEPEQHDPREIALGDIDPESALGKALRAAGNPDVTVAPEIGVENVQPWTVVTDDQLREVHLQIECETWRPGYPVPDPPRCVTYIACPTSYREKCRAAQRCTGEDETMG